MVWIDTHCHLQEEAFSQDLPAVLSRARDAQVSAFFVVGYDLASSRRAVELAEREADVWAVVGIQPNYVQEAGDKDLLEIEKLCQSARVVALGETGLDRYWNYSGLEQQADYFIRHIELSRELGLPFVVHCREAEDEVVAILRRAAAQAPLRGVMHSFAGDEQTASACLELGLYLSFSGMLTFKRHANLRKIAQDVPRDRILVETDAPYLAPNPHRGKRCEPAHIVHTGTCIAQLWNVPPESVAHQTMRNAQALFPRLPLEKL